MADWLAEHAWILGAVIVGVVLVQTFVVLYGSIRRVVHDRTARGLELAALEQRVAAARVVRREEELAALAWKGYRKFEVRRKVPEGGDICSFHLAPHDGKAVAGFRPGQYLTFDLDVPEHGKPVVRCYSLSDAPAEDGYRVTIKRLPPPRNEPDAPPGISSSYFHEHVNEGDILDVKAPAGNFFLDMSRETPVVLIGGGVGVTPVLSMLNTIVGRGSRRETWFFYGVRDGGEQIMKEHLRRLDSENDNVHLHVCYSGPADGDVLGTDYQHDGRVSVDLFRAVLPSNNYDFFICGPPPMMESLTRDLDAWGVPESRVHFEAFGPASVKKAAGPKPEGAAKESAPGPEITFHRSGKMIAWDGGCDSLLEFAEANGIVIDSGCRAGNCGTCLTAIKSGAVEYTTEPGEDPEDGSCLTCVCRPKGALVLDA